LNPALFVLFVLQWPHEQELSNSSLSVLIRKAIDAGRFAPFFMFAGTLSLQSQAGRTNRNNYAGHHFTGRKPQTI
jgi:hypothetical protein